MPERTPVFDRSKPYADIFHGGELQHPEQHPRYMQNGNYFRPDGSFHSSDGRPGARQVAQEAKPAPTPQAQKPTLPGVGEDELEALLQDPRAPQLLELPRDELKALVDELGGPTVYGERSTELMVAFVLKNTRPSNGGEPPRAPQAPPAALVANQEASDPAAGAALLPGDEDL